MKPLKNMNRFLTFLLLLSVTAVAYCQSHPYFGQQGDMGQEKLHLTLDRPYYEAGDTVWFRGTLVSAENLSYMVKTNYIYVELLNRADQVVMRRKVLREGLCFAHCLPLPSGLATGEYTLRAYTSWMRNFDPEFFFSRKLTVVNTRVTAPEDRQETDLDFGLTFFPEGGARIRGVAQRIAFKAEGSNGLPVEIDGIVKDAANRTIAEIHSTHDGMGVFTLPSNVGTAILFAEVQVRNYADRYGMPFGRTFPLPQVNGPAVALAINRIAEDTVSWRILGDNPGELVLILHSGSKLISEQEVTAPEGVLPLTACRDGVSHFVLATRDGIGLSRRLLFKYNPDNVIYGDIRLTDGNLRDPRELTTWRLALRDRQGHPMRGDFSVAVLDPGLVNCEFDSMRDNIVSNLLLTSDLKGYVHNAGWYFQDSVPATRRSEALDLVMLTHGWCRFATDTLRVRERDFPHPLEEREWLSGKVRELSWRDRDKTIPITVVDTTGKSYGMGQLDSLGNFFIGNLNYPDDARLHIRILARGKRPRFIFDKPTFPETGHQEPFRQDFKTYMEDTLNLRRFFIDSKGLRTRTLQNVEVTENRARRDTGKVVFHQNLGYEHLHDNYDLYVYDRAFDVVNAVIRNEWYKYLDETEAFEPIKTNYMKDDPLLDGIHKDRTHIVSYTPRVILVDGRGKRFRNLRFLELSRAEDIDSVVCTVTRPIQLGMHPVKVLINGRPAREMRLNDNYTGYVRTVYVYLKDGVQVDEFIKDRRRTAHYTFGYTPPVDFYNPIYKTPEEKAWPVPDLRKTLRWIPSLQTDERGEVMFQFYNSDHPGPRVFVIEGVTFSGKPFRIEQCAR